MRAKEAGFTLIEIMVVLIILGILYSFFGSKIVGAGDRARRQTTELQLMNVKQYISQFELQYGQLPTSLEDLTRCSQITGPNCMPIVSNPDDLKDAWKRPLVYTVGGDGRSFQLKSLGADGREGGDGANSDPTITGP
ncbi:MAG: prepilin-type N-terminal cleavage/methylation domain-containing protein [Deltaproteobacteria bacterium]|nr:prepilin-type N-terminal cleavage/methylation domain-containing protein [Deltaproteobacteria bacterium]